MRQNACFFTIAMISFAKQLLCLSPNRTALHTTQTIPIIQSLLIFYIRKRNLVNHQSDFTRFLMELIIGFEPMTSSLPITPFTCCGLSYRTQTVAITGIPFLLPSYLSIAWGDFSQDFTPNSPHSRRLALLLCSIAE